MSIPRFTAFAALTFAVALAACDSSDNPSSADADLRPTGFSREAVLATVDRDTYDGYLLTIAEQVSGFAGLVEENGELRVTVAKSASSPSTVASAALSAANDLAPAGDLLSAKTSAVPLEALYAFDDVMAWRGAIVAATPEIILHDADERKGIVYVEVESTASIDAVRKNARALGVPEDAVEVIVAPRFQRQIDIRNYGPYLEAGYAIAMAHGECTLGFMAFRGSSPGDIGGFVTNSHCTNSTGALGGLNNAQFYQGTGSFGNSSRYLGVELIDPAFYTLGLTSGGATSKAGPPVGGGGTPYRFSDAAFVDFELGSNNTSTLFGQIAKTQYSGSTSSGSFDRVNAFDITSNAETYQHPAGSTVHKVGRSTGWTTQTIIRTCTTPTLAAPNQNKELRCQYESTGISQPGDSGSPVFAVTGTNTARLQGIHWGSRVFNGVQETVYSPFDGINRDLRRSGTNGDLKTF